MSSSLLESLATRAVDGNNHHTEVADRRQSGLDAPEPAGRLAALEALRSQDPATKLPAHAASIVPLIADTDREVSWAALELLRSLQPAIIAQHATALLGALEHADPSVRWRAVELVGALEPHDLAHHADAVVRWLEHSDDDVRRRAAELLGRLDSNELSRHVGVLVPLLDDPDEDVRLTVVEVIGKLPPDELEVQNGAGRGRLKWGGVVSWQ